MSVPFISFDAVDPLLKWSDITEAMIAGHRLPRASITDGFAYRGDDTLLSRAAWIDGLGAAVKSATILPGNVAHGLPMIHGGVMLFDDGTGALEAVVDFHLVTKWKTAGDSLLGARLLARPQSRNVLLMGAGTVSRNLVSAYSSLLKAPVFKVWNRTYSKAEAMAQDLSSEADITAISQLEKGVDWADVICGATMSSAPVLKGAWLRAGQHVDLIGAYRPDMREADDLALQRCEIFVDSRDTTLDHIGELKTPLERGVISPRDIKGDLYDLVNAGVSRQTDSEITLFKNGGGAHLDLMTAKVILNIWRDHVQQ